MNIEEVEEPMEADDHATENQEKEKEKVYLPGTSLETDEELVYDKSAYVLYHRAQTGAPCLSFDIPKLFDNISESVEHYPLTMLMVCGTQSSQATHNNIVVCKMSKISKIKRSEKTNDNDDSNNSSSSSDESSDDSDEEDEKPELEALTIKHIGTVNRLRCSPESNPNFVATWSEKGKVYIWNINSALKAFNNSQSIMEFKSKRTLPIFSFDGHQSEGFAIDWSRTVPLKLATGDCNKNIHLWKPNESSWIIDQRPFDAHKQSIEDIQWSANEESVFASCSVDRTIKIWDDRVAPNKACMITVTDAHNSDINVINWNLHEPFIVSGGDDAVLNVWDLRQISSDVPKPVACFKHHTSPITSVEWHPTDSSVFAACAADDQLTIWDLAVERDMESEQPNTNQPDCPPQLLFIHQGQREMKELHWHPTLNGIIISTALSDFNIFKTISV